jgi:ATP-dependent Clp protease ATP-binding subunit ClpA
MALIQRAIRSGGLVLLPPVRKSLYAEIVKLSLKDVIDNFKRTSQVVLSVGDDLVGAVADIGVQNSMSPRGLDGVLKDLTETAIMEAQDEGLPMRGVILNLKLNEQRTEVVVQRLSEGKVANEYKSPVKSLLRSRCSSLLETTENETGRK